MPQVHAPGAGAEVDWGQALVELGGVPVTVHLFAEGERLEVLQGRRASATEVEAHRADAGRVEGGHLGVGDRRRQCGTPTKAGPRRRSASSRYFWSTA